MVAFSNRLYILGRQRLTSSDLTVGGGTPTVDFAYGKGVWLWDRSGRRFLDCTSQSWALYLGHSHDEIAEHAAGVMRRYWHVHQGFATDVREQFATKLLNLVPNNATRSRYGQVAFTATSGLAIESAIKLAVLNRPTRHVVGRVEGGFHGTTLGTAQLSWPAQEEVSLRQRTLLPFKPFGPDTFTLAFPSADPADRTALEQAIAELNRQLDPVAHELVAVVVEPIQGSGGQREVPRSWLQALIERANDSGFAVIFDEIQTYMRAGRYYSHLELEPHFVVLGKGLCGGFNCGAVLLRSDMHGFPEVGTYDLHTFATSGLSHSVGLKLLEIVERDDVLSNVRQRGAQLRATVESWCRGGVVFDDVRQVGLHVGLRVIGGDAVASRLRQHCVEHGLLVGMGGYDPSVIKIKPPLNITDAETSEILKRLEQAGGDLST